MNIIIDKKLATPSSQLCEQLIALNQSVKGMLPVITTKNVDDILKLTIATTALAWNWSKSFNYQQE